MAMVSDWGPVVCWLIATVGWIWAARNAWSWRRTAKYWENASKVPCCHMRRDYIRTADQEKDRSLKAKGPKHGEQG